LEGYPRINDVKDVIEIQLNNNDNNEYQHLFFNACFINFYKKIKSIFIIFSSYSLNNLYHFIKETLLYI